MKEKFRVSALFAGIAIMLAPTISFAGRIIRMTVQGDFNQHFIYYLYLILLAGLGLTAAVAAFTKLAKLPAAICGIFASYVNFYWAIDDIEWLSSEFSYEGIGGIYTWDALCYVLMDIFELLAVLLVGMLLITSLVKPDLKALKPLGFVPFVLELLAVIFYVISWLIEMFADGVEDYLEWIIENGYWASDTGNVLSMLLLIIGLLLLGISLRPKKVKEIKEM